jgi:lactate permease
MLVALALCSLLYLRLGLTSRPALRMALASGARTALPVTLGVLAMMSLAMVLDHAGMTQALARALSEGVGRAFPLLSPFVGLMGAFTTGSNTNSNVLFGPLQVEMARLLNLSPVWLLAGQTAGGALGSMVAPTKLVVGCAAVGALGQDGRVLARTAPYAIALVVALGGLCLVLAWGAS